VTSPENAPAVANGPVDHDRWAIFAFRDVRFYLFVRLFFMLGAQMQSVAIGWLVYEKTHTALSLGLVGLFQFLPAVVFAFVGGALADRFERRRLLLVVLLGIAALSLTLFLLTGLSQVPIAAVYTVLFLLGIGRSFSGPASQALVANLVPKTLFPRLVATASVVMNGAILVGPSLGGLLLGLFSKQHPAWLHGGGGARGVFLLVFVLISLAASLVAAMKTESRAEGSGERKKVDLATFFAGLRYVFANRALLGSISLDLFAVLLGGVVALLPVFAKDILHAGPTELGLLRSASGAGALVMGLVLGVFPIRRRAGVLMFASVFAFGLLTIAFALSRNIMISVMILAALGAVDMVSVVIRSTLVQLETPDAMRGRVSAVNMIFISASNELGEFESGVTAELFGVIPAAVVGGVGTCLVVLLWMIFFPSLRKFDRMESAK
jgi:MFS family permease